jgi:hypothetical protein
MTEPRYTSGVVPAKAGTHNPGAIERARRMGPRFRGGDER